MRALGTYFHIAGLVKEARDVFVMGQVETGGHGGRDGGEEGGHGRGGEVGFVEVIADPGVRDWGLVGGVDCSKGVLQKVLQGTQVGEKEDKKRKKQLLAEKR